MSIVLCDTSGPAEQRDDRRGDNPIGIDLGETAGAQLTGRRVEQRGDAARQPCRVEVGANDAFALTARDERFEARHGLGVMREDALVRQRLLRSTQQAVESVDDAP